MPRFRRICCRSRGAMGADFVAGNQLTLLNSGGEYFPALLGAIASAQHEIHLETYLFEDDRSGRAVATALIDAARRGVQVRLLVDGFGARDLASTLLPEMSAAGVMALVYRPDISPWRIRFHRLRRLHRKLAVIDNATAFIGGINIIDDLNSPAPSAPRHDYAVRVAGPLVQTIRQAMRRQWESVSWASLHRRYRSTPERGDPPTACGAQRAALIIRDSFRHRRDIETAYLAAIDAARDSILIANAYFLPGRRFRKALYAAARRGVKVTLLLQGRVEYRLLHYATQSLYARLLKAGIRLFEYRHSYLHAKVAVIDGRWATVGSSNIDPFSLLLAKEANLVVEDCAFAGELHACLEQAIRQGAEELHLERWQQHPWPIQWLRGLSYNLIRAAIGMSGYGRKH